MNKFIYIMIVVIAVFTGYYLFLVTIPLLWFVFREEKSEFRRKKRFARRLLHNKAHPFKSPGFYY